LEILSDSHSLNEPKNELKRKLSIQMEIEMIQDLAEEAIRAFLE
jgi:hypothetical protein